MLSQLKDRDPHQLFRTRRPSAPRWWRHGAHHAGAARAGEAELAGMRERASGATRAPSWWKAAGRGVKGDLSYITRQKGMFSFSGPVGKAQMQRLRSEFGIYGSIPGRICVAAINSRNIDAVVAALARVMTLPLSIRRSAPGGPACRNQGTAATFVVDSAYICFGGGPGGRDRSYWSSDLPRCTKRRRPRRRTMLYQLYETQRALMAPFSGVRQRLGQALRHPLSPFRTPDGAAHVGRLRPHAPPGQGIRKPAFTDHQSATSTASRWRCRSRYPSPSRSAACCASSASPTTPRRWDGDEDCSPRCWWWRRCRATIPRCCATP